MVLLGILQLVKRFEVEGLLADKAPYRGSMTRMLVSAALLSTGVKLWTGGTPAKVTLGLTITTLVWLFDLRASADASVTQPVSNGRVDQSPR